MGMMERTLSGETWIRERRRRWRSVECDATSLQNEVRRRRNERNCERDAAERVAAKGSSISIPRHAPSYHIDLAIVTILSSPAMLGCTIAAGGRGMPESEESCRGEGQGSKRDDGGRSYRMVYHATPRWRECGTSRVECERERVAERC